VEDTNAVEVRPAAASPARSDAPPEFPDWAFAPNIGNHPGIYEIENAALDRGGHVLDLMRQLAPWAGRTIVDLGCGTGFWLPRYAAEARRVNQLRSLTYDGSNSGVQVKRMPQRWLPNPRNL